MSLYVSINFKESWYIHKKVKNMTYKFYIYVVLFILVVPFMQCHAFQNRKRVSSKWKLFVIDTTLVSIHHSYTSVRSAFEWLSSFLIQPTTYDNHSIISPFFRNIVRRHWTIREMMRWRSSNPKNVEEKNLTILNISNNVEKH